MNLIDQGDQAQQESGENNKRKSASAFRTIGEVSADLNLPPHVLRFWESKFKQIKPQKRRGGHRYYRPEDVANIKEIKSLLHDRGYTIKGAQKYLKDMKKGDSSNDNAAPNAESTTTPEVISANANDNKEYLQNVISQLIEVRDILKSA